MANLRPDTLRVLVVHREGAAIAPYIDAMLYMRDFCSNLGLAFEVTLSSEALI